MGRTTIEHKSNKWMIENRLTYPEAINERELHAIAGGLMESLIPVSTENSKKGVILKSNVTGMLPLKSYFTGIVNKKMFLSVISQLIAIMKECEKNLMNVHNMMFDSDYIFIDPRTKKVTCIFWPIVNNQNAPIPATFFQELPFSIVFNNHENLDYVIAYIRFFNNQAHFSINSFEKFIFEMLGKVVENKSHIPSGSTGSMKNGDSQQVSNRDEAVKGKGNSTQGPNISYNPLTNLANSSYTVVGQSRVCSKCGSINNGSKLCVVCGTELPSSQINISEILHEHEPSIPHHEDQVHAMNASQHASNPFNPAMSCPHCERIKREEARFCAVCGTSFVHSEASATNNHRHNTSVHFSIETDISKVLAKTDTENFSETTVLGTDEYGGTTVLGADIEEVPIFPYLVREKTQEEIRVDKPFFRIGKDRSTCDYLVLDNNAVSRSHANIITRDNRYFIVDHNSTNKTYVDERRIPAKKEIEIFSGTKLKLANEKFVFYI